MFVYFAQMSYSTMSKLKVPWQTLVWLGQPTKVPDLSYTATRHGNALRLRIFDSGYKCIILWLLSSISTSANEIYIIDNRSVYKFCVLK